MVCAFRPEEYYESRVTSAVEDGKVEAISCTTWIFWGLIKSVIELCDMNNLLLFLPHCLLLMQLKLCAFVVARCRRCLRFLIFSALCCWLTMFDSLSKMSMNEFSAVVFMFLKFVLLVYDVNESLAGNAKNLKNALDKISHSLSNGKSRAHIQAKKEFKSDVVSTSEN